MTLREIFATSLVDDPDDSGTIVRSMARRCHSEPGQCSIYLPVADRRDATQLQDASGKM